MRRWARENYVRCELRPGDWHAVIHDEMSRRDRELQVEAPCRRSGIVPILPTGYADDGPHALRGPSGAVAHAHDAGGMHYS